MSPSARENDERSRSFERGPASRPADHAGASSRARHIDTSTTLLALGGATLTLGVLVYAMMAGTDAREDPFGRCGDYPPPPPER